MTEIANVERLAMAGAAVAAGVVAGLVLRLVLGRLTDRARSTRWSWDDLAFTLLKDVALVVCGAAGAWTAVLALELRPPLRDLAYRVLVAGVILAVSLAAARLAGGIVSSVALARAGVAQAATIFVNIAKIVVLSVGLMVLLQSIGVSVTPLLTALGVGGLAVALALQDTLANLFAGVHILASRKVVQGDFVRLDSGEEGHIVDINWRNTTIEQLPGNLVIVPNAKFADAIVTNYHRPAQDMSVLVQVGVAYDSDLEHVERVTVEVASEVTGKVEGAVPDHEPFIRFHTFGDSAINFSVILRTREFTDQYLVVHEFIKRLHERYHTEGIAIPYPTRNVVVTDRPSGPARVPEPAGGTRAGRL
jgi:small-conductance mechanosensitive channel